MDENMIQRAIIMNEEAEKRWQAANELRVADREFRRSRHRAYRRMLGPRREEDKTATSFIKTWDEGEIRVELGKLTGMSDEKGNPSRGIPPMPKSLLREWLGLYLRGGVEEEDWLFTLRSYRGEWYLAGGNAALLKLEILRMRGEESVRAKAESLPERDSDFDQGKQGCRSGDLGAA
jgi:hypothetical protein